MTIFHLVAMEHRSTIFFTAFSLVCIACLWTPSHASGSVEAMFAFGDSTVDSGNNNRLVTVFRSDHIPYGRDLPDHQPTGRFSNGRLVTDYLVSSLGIKNLLPAYLDPQLADNDLLTGVSFGSGGSGLDDITATTSKVLDLSTQLDYFDEALERLKTTVGPERASALVENSLFVISSGTNDMLYNAYLSPRRMLEFSVSGYQDFLLGKLESVVQRLYDRGGRRYWVVGLPPIGCLPLQVTLGSIPPSFHMFQRLCIQKQNEDSQAYNTKLKALTLSLQSRLKGVAVAYIDIYDSLMDMIANAQAYGFEHTSEGCCGTGLMEMGPLCSVVSPTCSDASKYPFWDAVHLTEAAYSIIGAKILLSNPLNQNS